MFVVLLCYQEPIEKIDAVMNEHVSFLRPHFQDGTFVAAGRKLPRTGGVILARKITRAALEEIMNNDPFCKKGLATFEIIEFRTSLYSPTFAAFADPKTRPLT